jgi:hypothetical protein
MNLPGWHKQRLGKMSDVVGGDISPAPFSDPILDNAVVHSKLAVDEVAHAKNVAARCKKDGFPAGTSEAVLDEFELLQPPSNESHDVRRLRQIPLDKPLYQARPSVNMPLGEILKIDKQRLHLPENADLHTVAKAIEKQSYRLMYEQVGLTDTNKDFQELWERCRQQAQVESYRRSMHLPGSYSPCVVDQVVQQWLEFQNKYNVDVVHKSDRDKLIYTRGSSSNRILIGEIHQPSNHLTAAREIVEGWVNQEKAKLSAQYHCTFTPSGQIIPSFGYYAEKENKSGGKPTLFTVEPTVTELIGLRKALERSSFDFKKQPLNFAFSNDSDGRAGAFCRQDKPIIVFEGSCRTMYPLQSNFDRSGYVSSDRSTEAIADHELAHAEQHMQGWFNPGQLAETLRKRYGFICLKPGSIDNNDWFLPGKDGYLYRHIEGEVACPKWIRFDKTGNMLNPQGVIVKDPANALILSEDEMRKISVTPFATSYFDHAEEADAEATMLFALGNSCRKQLLKMSPKIYDLAKGEDQDAINTKYGVASDGKPKYVRNVDGLIVPSTQAILSRIANFERMR